MVKRTPPDAAQKSKIDLAIWSGTFVNLNAPLTPEKINWKRPSGFQPEQEQP